MLAANERIRPLHDYLVIEPLAVDHGGLLEIIEHTLPLRGRVVAVGPGH